LSAELPVASKDRSATGVLADMDEGSGHMLVP
jgi:hypothetical protein